MIPQGQSMNEMTIHIVLRQLKETHYLRNVENILKLLGRLVGMPRAC